MSLNLVLADNQISFRAGAAQILSQQPTWKIIAQLDSESALRELLQQYRDLVVLLSSSLTTSLPALLDALEEAACRSILILEPGFAFAAGLQSRFHGIVPRSLTPEELLDCVRRVGQGVYCVHIPVSRPAAPIDRIGQKVLSRLTPKELQIIALIGESRKNREIAEYLGTKEQVVKNYLRAIYRKTGVADRLELALYTLHHAAIAQAVNQVRAARPGRT